MDFIFQFIQNWKTSHNHKGINTCWVYTDVQEKKMLWLLCLSSYIWCQCYSSRGPLNKAAKVTWEVAGWCVTPGSLSPKSVYITGLSPGPAQKGAASEFTFSPDASSIIMSIEWLDFANLFILWQFFLTQLLPEQTQTSHQEAVINSSFLSVLIWSSFRVGFASNGMSQYESQSESVVAFSG